MSNNEVYFSVNRRDWSFRQSGPEDEIRHNEKVKEAIRDRLPEIISDGSIITADPSSKRIIKIPLKTLELPKFRFGDNNGQGVGGGDGKPGDQIGGKPGQPGQGEGQAGEDEAQDFYEAEISLDEIKRMVYEDLGLPYLEPKGKDEIFEEHLNYNDVRHRYQLQNIDIMRTVMENMKRNAVENGEPSVGNFDKDDIWIRTWNIEVEQISSAVIIAMADISGSMGDFEKYVTRAFCWWMVDAMRFLYPKVNLAFIVHDTVAMEVSESDFFTINKPGGTVCSSANKLAREIMLRRFSPDKNNVYLLHFSDGDNVNTDNGLCVQLVNEFLEMGISQYGYVQIGTSTWPGLLDEYKKHIFDDRFHALVINDVSDIYPSLQEMFDPNKK